MTNRHLCAALISAVISLALVETLLRVGIAPPVVWLLPQEEYLADPNLGHRLKPFQVAYTHDKEVRISSLGIRDHEYERSSSRSIRILALGDSQTFGVGLELKDTWPKQLEARLAVERPGLEVVNAGVPATDTWQHELLMLELFLALKPHLTILALYVNDITAGTGRSQFQIRPESHWSRRIIYAVKRSALGTALLQAREPLRALMGNPSSSALTESHILTGVLDPLVEKGWSQVENSLIAMRDLARSRGTSLAVVILPRRDQITGTTRTLKFNRRAAQLCRGLSIRSIDPLSDLREAHETYGAALFIPWDGHNSAIANSVISGVIARNLAAELDHSETMLRSSRTDW